MSEMGCNRPHRRADRAHHESQTHDSQNSYGSPSAIARRVQPHRAGLCRAARRPHRSRRYRFINFDDPEPRRRLLPWREQPREPMRSEEHKSELQSLMRISFAVFCLQKKTDTKYLIVKYVSTKGYTH